MPPVTLERTRNISAMKIVQRSAKRGCAVSLLISFVRRSSPQPSYSRTSFTVGIRPIMSIVDRRRKAASLIIPVVITPVSSFSRRRRSSSIAAAWLVETGGFFGMATRLGASGFRSLRVTPLGQFAPAFTQASSSATSSGVKAWPSSGITPSSIGRRWIRTKSSLFTGLPGTRASAVSPPSRSFS